MLWLPDASPAWRPLRRALALSRGGLAVAAIALGITLLVMVGLGPQVERWPEPVQTVVGMSEMGGWLGGILAWLIGGAWCNRFRCPRCGRPFFARSGRWVTSYNSWARHCMNCGLPRWADAAASGAPTV